MTETEKKLRELGWKRDRRFKDAYFVKGPLMVVIGSGFVTAWNDRPLDYMVLLTDEEFMLLAEFVKEELK